VAFGLQTARSSRASRGDESNCALSVKIGMAIALLTGLPLSTNRRDDMTEQNRNEQNRQNRQNQNRENEQNRPNENRENEENQREEE
jgi:hypothetical protein